MMKLKPLNPEITCNDGTTISVQASSYHYSTPRDNEGPYSHVEVGFPSVAPTNPDFRDRAEDEDFTNTVYGWVPLELVKEFIDEHGGIKSGELP